MRTRHLYLLAGVLWALVLGPLTAIAVASLAAGVAWLYVFGDKPWPAASHRVLGLLALAAGLLAAAVAVWVGYRLGAGSSRDPLRERRRALALLLAPVLLVLLVGTLLWIEARDFRQAMAIASLREQAFAELAGTNQKVVAVTIARETDEIFRAMVHISGDRDGDYRLSWSVRDSGFSSVLLTGEEILKLRRGTNQARLSFSQDQLAERYRTIVLDGGSGVLVEEPFRLEVAQEPVLTAQEMADLPPGEVRRLGTDQSSLLSEKSVSFPVRFTIAP